MNKGLYVVMGVSGSGKTIVGSALAHALGVEFVEGDDFHSVENVKRMASGIPLTDGDRAGWLRLLGARLREARDAGTGLVMSCSALKRAYRDLLRAEGGELRFVFLNGDQGLIATRLAGRHGHYMPVTLLASQFRTLEQPGADENVWVCDINDSPEDIVAGIVARAPE
jgi:gluconokinase